MKKGNLRALAPISVIILFCMGLGTLFEYVLKVPSGFSNLPIVVAFMLALLVACLQNPRLKFDDKLELMGKGIGDRNIVTMVLIFITAGAFVGVIGHGSAESVAYFVLSVIPTRFAVAALFLISSFISLAMGTSVGTIALITPIAVSISTASNFPLPLCAASVVGGAMFGDNLSFISDTTIAACHGQGCHMKDKFRENFKIALPAALATLIFILIMSFRQEISAFEPQQYDLIQAIPYLLVLVGGIIGINVFLVLLAGIFSGGALNLIIGREDFHALLTDMGAGMESMFEISIITVLTAAICALISEYGGFDALLYHYRRIFKGYKGGQLGIGLLVGAMDVATTNNTVAIVISNPIVRAMSADYGITPRKAASLMDTFSCVFQGLIPYGAQQLLAISVCANLGCRISAFEILPNLTYPFMLLVSSLLYIFVLPGKKKAP